MFGHRPFGITLMEQTELEQYRYGVRILTDYTVTINFPILALSAIATVVGIVSLVLTITEKKINYEKR